MPIVYLVRHAQASFGTENYDRLSERGRRQSRWLGGLAVDMSGNYDWMWYADIALALAAALVNLPIREAPPKLAAAAA